MDLRVKYHSDIKQLEQSWKGDWIDLRAAEEVYLKPGQEGFISLGISVELPEGYEAHILPRSSTFRHWGIIQTNSCGIIDNSYCGDDDIWMLPYFATKFSKVEINDRICQFRIVKRQPLLDFKVVESLENDNRGGLGSSGKG